MLIKYSLITILILGGLVLISNQAFLYSSDTTHPYLTEQIVKFYNYYYEPDITLEQLEKMKEGGIHEDFGDRSWWYHFYDPIYNTGSGGLTAKQWAQNPEKQASAPGGDHSWQTAINEYNTGYKQKAFYSLGHILHLIEDMSVPSHTRNDMHYNGGDPFENWAGKLPRDSELYNLAQPLVNKGIKPKIFNNLDTYFDNAALFSNQNFFSKDSVEDTTVESRYFGPKIVKEGWENGQKYAYGKVAGSLKLIHLARAEKNKIGTEEYLINDTTPEIHADYFSILSKGVVINGAGVVKLFFDSITEPEKEIIEPEKQLSFWQNIGNSIVGGVRFLLSAIDGLIHTPPSAIESVIEESMPDPEYLTTTPVGVKEIVNNLKDEGVAKPPIPPQGGFATPLSDEENVQSSGEIEFQKEEVFLVKRVIDGDTIVLENDQEVRYIGIDAPEFPDGCFAKEAADKNKELLEGKQVRLEKDISETDKYGRLLRYVYLDSLFINDYLVRNGYAYDFAYEPNIKFQEQFAKAEEVAKENRHGLWGDICHPIIVQGPKTGGGGDAGISGRLLEEMANQSQNLENTENTASEQEQSPEENPGDQTLENEQQELEQLPQESQDTTPPDISIKPLVCNYASSSITIEWLSLEYPSASFDVEYKEGDGEWQSLLENTNEIQTTFLIANKDTTYSFRVRGRDQLGNESNWQETSIEVFLKPVVINEIAWMGTQANPNDEWIELHNKADYDIDLTDWILISDDRSPEITLNKIISAKGYYLLERTDDNTTSQPADWYGSFGSGGLKNSGEILELRDTANNLIDSVDNWYAGDNSENRTMERINPAAAGTEPKNWKTYIGPGFSATDVEGNPIFGTPKAKNSVYKLYTAVTKHIIEDTVWILENSPYLVYDNNGGSYELLEIAEGTTLTIEPGVIVKFINPGLKALGTIKAEGTSSKPIVFTDYNDDSYGGDIPGSSAIPQAGFWSGIWFTSTSADSILDNVILRYAGSRTRPFRSGSTYSFPGVAVGAGIRVEDTSIVLKNSIIENNLFAGVLLTNSSNTIIENSTFQNHLEYDNSYSTLASPTELRNIALYIDSSNPKVKDSAFQNNLTGIYIVNNSQPASPMGGPIIENNIFSNNSRPIWVQSSYPQFSNNQLKGNNWDGIVIKGLKLNQDYTLGGGSVFINYEEIPFWSIVVPKGYTLTIEPGTIIKSVYSTSGLLIEGTLIAEGTAEKPIVFTSFYDDEYGGDTNGDGDKAEYCRTKDPDDNTYLNCPRAGFWGQIVFTSTSTDSSLNYAIIRYGGTKWGQSYNYQPDYVLKIENTSIAIANSIFENNTSGAYFENSSSHIANTEFRNHQYSQPFSYFISTGIWLVSSNPTIDISTFLNNKLGIYIDAASVPILTSPVFSGNDKDVEDMRPQEGGT